MIYSNSTIVDFTCEQMYRLVNDFESYPKFVKFCSDGFRDAMDENCYTATLEYRIGKFSKTIRTRNVATPHSEITMKLVSGPFKKLNGKWTFLPVGDDKCQVKLEVVYEFSSKATEIVWGTFFKTLPKTMVDNFRNEAIRRYRSL